MSTEQLSADTLTMARDAVTAELVHAITVRDHERVHAAAVWLRATGLPVADLYVVMLREAERPAGDSPVQQARLHESHEFLRDVVARLRPHRVGPGRGQAVVSVPDGLRHALGITVLYHLVEECDYRVVPVGETPLAHLPEVVDACEDPAAVILWLHDVASLAPARAAVDVIRTRHPRIRVLVGGRLSARPRLLATIGAHAVFTRLDEIVVALEQGANPLSPRERDVLACVATGLSNLDTGTQLGIAAATVKTHLDRVNAKLGTSDRTAAVAVALRKGWID